MEAFLTAASLSVFVHELGHALAQRMCGVPVERVVFGMGPRLMRIGKLEVRLIPFSGYVTPPGALLAKRRWQGVLIALSGVLSTWIVVGFIILTQAVRVWWLKDFCVWWTFWAFAGLLQLLPFRHRDGWWALVALGVLPYPPLDRRKSSSVFSNQEEG